MIFRNKLIFNEAKEEKETKEKEKPSSEKSNKTEKDSNNKKSSSKDKKDSSFKEDDVDMNELKNNVEKANSEMEKVLSTAGLEKKPKNKKMQIDFANSTDKVEKELKNSDEEESSDDNFGNIEADNFYEPEDEEETVLSGKDADDIQPTSKTNKSKKSNKQNSNSKIEFEDDSDNLENIEDAIDAANDDEEETDYMGDEDSDELSLDDYEDDSEDLDDIESQIDAENNDETANDGEFDPDDDLENIDSDIDRANDEEFEITDDEEIEDDAIQDSDPNMPEGDIQGQTEEEGPEEYEVEMDPNVTGDPTSLPTDGLDDDELDDIGSEIDGASQQGDMQDPNGGMDDPNALGDGTGYDPNDPLYYDDSDPLENDINKDPKDDESERLKKLVLLNQYKDLINVIGDFVYTVEKLREVPDFENDEDVNYIIDQLNSMKDKITFTVEQKFLSADYVDLLKIFYYFKFGINSVSKFMEKLIQTKQIEKDDKKSNKNNKNNNKK